MKRNSFISTLQRSQLSAIYLILRGMRPRQWTKNLLLFAGLFFSVKLFDPLAFQRALFGFLTFCLLSGSIYLLNDILDREKDRLHPIKRRRPVASGDLAVGTAGAAALFIVIAALLWSYWISPYFCMCAAAYTLMMIAYSVSLKDVFLIDTMIIAMGFIIRAVSGVIVLRVPDARVPLTSWFVVCVMFLSLLLAFCKRRSERVKYSEEALLTRPVLQMYSVALLDRMIGVCSACTIISYTLYATTAHVGWVMWMWLTTLPFVLFGISRYLYLVYSSDDGESPEWILTRDPSIMGCVAMWLLSLVVIFYLG